MWVDSSWLIVLKQHTNTPCATHSFSKLSIAHKKFASYPLQSCSALFQTLPESSPWASHLYKGRTLTYVSNWPHPLLSCHIGASWISCYKQAPTCCPPWNTLLSSSKKVLHQARNLPYYAYLREFLCNVQRCLRENIYSKQSELWSPYLIGLATYNFILNPNIEFKL